MARDFRFSTDTCDHPKILKLIRSHGYEGFFALVRLWGHATEHFPKGVLTGFDAEDVTAAARINGNLGPTFTARLIELRLLDVTEGVYSLHNWTIRQSWACGADDRSKAASVAGKASAEQKKNQRNRNIQRRVNAASTGRSPNVERTLLPSPSPSPSPLPNPNPPPTPVGVTTTTLDRRPDKTAVDRVVDEAFNLFWTVYPKKIGKGAARKAWSKIRPGSEKTTLIVAAVERQKGWSQWRKDGGQFIPHPATWLNQSRWEDEGHKEMGLMEMIETDPWRPPEERGRA